MFRNSNKNNHFNTNTPLISSGVMPTSVNSFLSNQPAPDSTKPKAYLNCLPVCVRQTGVLLDEQFKFVQSSSGAEQVGNDQELKVHVKNNPSVTKSGYLYVFVSNELRSNQRHQNKIKDWELNPNISVYWDNLQVTHVRGPLLEEIHYYPFGLTMAGISSKALQFGGAENRLKYNGKELQSNEFSDNSGLELYDFGARMQDPQLGRWWTVDPLAARGPQFSPYSAFFNNPIIFTDPDGRWPIYGKDGGYLGDDGKYEKGKDLAFTGTATYDKKGNITGYENLSQFTDNHTQFQTISNIVKQEGITNDANEYLWVAHTANNAANASGKSLYSKLMSGYSSVGKADKTALSISDNSTTAKYARAGVIDVMSGGADPTGGATLWDGTDFLAWGLKSPNGTPQNKFEEYKSISISGDIYSSFLNSQLSKYTSGKVKYSGTYYNLPADVFTDKANWNKEGNFFFNTGEKQPYGLKATGTAGRSIFWKKEK